MIKHILLKRIIGIILFAGAMLTTYAEDTTKYIISYKHISLENGLVGRQVLCGMQDSKGFMWIGTTHGLQRFDGKNFVTYTREKNGLQDNIISKIVEDEQQRLWIMYGLSGGYAIPSANKIDILDLRTNTIQSFATTFRNKLPFALKDIGTIYSNEKKQFIFLNYNNSNNKKIDFSTNSFSIYYYNKKVGFFNTNKNTNLIFGFDNLCFKGDSLITIHNDSIKVYNVAKNNKKEYINNFQKVFFIKNNTLFFNKINTNKFETIPFGKVNSNYFSNNTKTLNSLNKIESLNALFNDVNNTSTMYVSKKLEVFIFNGEECIKVLDNSTWGKNVNIKIYNYFITNKDTYWICTSLGMYRVKITKNNFTQLLSSNSYKLSMPSQYQNRNIHILGNNNFILNSWGGTYNITKSKNDQWIYNKIADLSDKSDYTDGSYFNGTYYYKKTENGLLKYNLQNKIANTIQSFKNIIWVGITTKENNLIVASEKNLFLINDAITYTALAYANGTSIPNNWINQFYYTKDGTLWAVGNNGIFTINNKNVIINHYTTNTSISNNKLPYNDINSIIEDAQGTLWLATNGGGLVKWNRKNNTFTIFTITDGLSTNVLYGILQDEKGQLWISSDNGIIKFNTNTNYIKTYTTKDGITNNEFNRCSFAKAPDGLLLFGGMDGVNAFYSSAFYSDTTASNAAFKIISFQKYSGKKNTLVDETLALTETNKISIQPTDNLCILQFQVLDFEIGEHKYAYKIEGLDKDWNYTNENTIRLSNLPYGKYILKIKGQNQEGEWNINELNIDLEVITPFYKKRWFIIVALLGVLAVIYAYTKYKTFKLEKEKKVLERTVNLRTSQLNKSLEQKEILLREIHHRVKNNLSVINSLLELQANNIIDVQAKKALQESQNRVSSIALIHQRLYQHENLAAIDVKEFIEDLYKHINTVFYDKKNSVYTNFIAKNILLDIDTAVPLGLIINELLTNSFKYGFTPNKEGLIDMKLYENPNGNYLLTYKDNGPGVGDTFALQKNTTLGFKLIKSLAKQLSGKADYIQQDNQFLFTLQFKDTLNRNEE